MTSPSGPSETTWVMPISWPAGQPLEVPVVGDDLRQLVQPLQAEVAHPFRHRAIVCRIMGARRFDERDERPPSRRRRPRSGCSRAGWPTGRSGVVSGYRINRLGPRRRGTGRRWPGVASRCCTSPSGTSPAARRPAARQGPRAVGRAHLRRADGAVDGHQRDVRAPRSTIPPTRSVGATARPAPSPSTSSGTPRRPGRGASGDGYQQEGVVHGDRSSCRRAAGPHRGAGPALAPVGRRAGRARAAGRVRPRRGAGAVRVPRRDRRRLGASPRTAGGRVLRLPAPRVDVGGGVAAAGGARSGGARPARSGPARARRGRTGRWRRARARWRTGRRRTRPTRRRRRRRSRGRRRRRGVVAAAVDVMSSVSVDIVTRSSSADCVARSTSRSVSRRVSSASSRTTLSMSTASA